MKQAEAFITGAAKANVGDVDWARTVVDLALMIGGRNWASVQKLAFALMVPTLLHGGQASG